MIIKITVKSRKMERALRKMQKNAELLRPALIKIGGMLEGASDNAFEREGPGWKPLKPATVKQRGGNAHPILNRSGGRGLVGSVTSQVRGNTVFIGSNLKYARAQQLGYKTRNLPARPYLVVGRKEIAKAVKILERHLVKDA